MCCAWTSVETFLTLPWRLRSTLSALKSLWESHIILLHPVREVSAPLTNFYSSLDPTSSKDPDGPDTMTHTRSQSSTHRCEAVCAVWLISKLQPEYLETSNPGTLPFGNFYISHIQKKRRTQACTLTQTHTHKLKMKTPSVWQQQTNTQCVKSIMYAQQDAEVPVLCCPIFDVQHCSTHRCIWKWGHLLASAKN